MRAVDYVRSVRHTLTSNPLRAALTLLGTVIGSASIVLLAGLLRSGEEMMVDSSQRASESDLISVRSQPMAFGGGQMKVLRELSRWDEHLIDTSPLFPGARASTESQRETTANAVTDGKQRPDVEKDYNVRLVSASPGTVSLYRLQIDKGRGLDASDLSEKTRTCVVGSEVWRKLFGEKTELQDQRLRIDGHLWVIVGVLRSKPILGGGGDGTWMWNRKVLIPETTFDTMFRPHHYVDRMFVRLAASTELKTKLAAAEGLLRGVLLRTHGAENFKIEAENSSEGQTHLILSIIKGLLLSTALLSLFVGGINIMNIMLVTVTERTREIGVRRALGAPPRSIWIQFLLEATFIAGVGGLVGVGSGIGLTWIAARAIGGGEGSFAFRVETWSVVLGITLSMVTGIVFGLFPAVRASRLDPVEALRFE